MTTSQALTHYPLHVDNVAELVYSCFLHLDSLPGAGAVASKSGNPRFEFVYTADVGKKDSVQRWTRPQEMLPWLRQTMKTPDAASDQHVENELVLYDCGRSCVVTEITGKLTHQQDRRNATFAFATVCTSDFYQRASRRSLSDSPTAARLVMDLFALIMKVINASISLDFQIEIQGRASLPLAGRYESHGHKHAHDVDGISSLRSYYESFGFKEYEYNQFDDFLIFKCKPHEYITHTYLGNARVLYRQGNSVTVEVEDSWCHIQLTNKTSGLLSSGKYLQVKPFEKEGLEIIRIGLTPANYAYSRIDKHLFNARILSVDYAIESQEAIVYLDTNKTAKHQMPFALMAKLSSSVPIDSLQPGIPLVLHGSNDKWHIQSAPFVLPVTLLEANFHDACNAHVAAISMSKDNRNRKQITLRFIADATLQHFVMDSSYRVKDGDAAVLRWYTKPKKAWRLLALEQEGFLSEHIFP